MKASKCCLTSHIPLLGLLLASCTPGQGDGLSQPSTLMYPAVTARILGKQEGGGSAVAFSPDGQALASVAMGHPGGKLWSLRDGSHRNLDNAEWAITFAPNGESLATVGRSRAALPEAVQILDLRHGAVRVLGAHGGTVISVAYSPDSQLLASGSADRTVRLCNVRTGTHQVLQHPRSAQAVPFSPDGRALAVGVRDGSIKVWKLVGEVVASLPECGVVNLWEGGCGGAVLSGHAQPVNSIVFSPDGATLASGSSDGTVKLWNLRDGRYRTLTAGDVVHAISFSKSGDMLAASTGGTMVHTRGTIVLWDFRKGTHGVLVENPPGNASPSIVFSPTSNTLASIDYDGTVKVWQLE